MATRFKGLNPIFHTIHLFVPLEPLTPTCTYNDNFSNSVWRDGGTIFLLWSVFLYCQSFTCMLPRKLPRPTTKIFSRTWNQKEDRQDRQEYLLISLDLTF